MLSRSRVESQLQRASWRLLNGVASKGDRFVRSVPSPQNAIDAVGDAWASRLPSPYESLSAGHADLFDDPRMTWSFERLNGLDGKTVLELGPLEGGHSYMAERAGAAHVIGVEANRHAFLKCLVAKELLGLSRCSFQCGDVVEYLAADPASVDVCVACGILYHMTEPVRLIELISRAATDLVLWTHYYDDSILLNNKALARRLGPEEAVRQGGFDHHVHRHRYGADRLMTGRGFCAGTSAFSSWLPRADLLGALRHFGWNSIEISFETPDGPNGPALALVARRDGESDSSTTS